MGRTKRETTRIKPTGQAQALSQEILAGMRRNSHDHVSMDEDSMENIDAYWNMANKELEEMERKQYEDISLLDFGQSPAKKTEAPIKERVPDRADETELSILSSPRTIRRSFDEEFQDDLQTAILTGFSDSEEDQKEAEEASQQGLKKKKCQPQKRALAGTCREQPKIPRANSAERSKRGNSRKVAAAAQRAPKALPENSLLFKETDKIGTDSWEFTSNNMRAGACHIKPGRAQTLEPDCIYYITRGSIVVKDSSAGPEEQVAIQYRRQEIVGRKLKAGAVFSNTKPFMAHNAGMQVCTLIVLSSEGRP
ncbi:uncharacterized protein NEMAJ01_1772 [Nematocida major]|uniref:uncharacterized protein n=1 Tax=Nematocida major TaxID=1912982 RepID=UPI002007FF6F|nr:uncharacterized protein NEMAJ01_1772 [Nematocida major]KAH9386876.1 hypothetical protein NEMAJ01_1772 [Nematocida major]